MWVVDTDYNSYALLYTSGTKGVSQDVHMATLYSTCPAPPQGLTEGCRGCGEQSRDLPRFSFLPQAVARPSRPK